MSAGILADIAETQLGRVEHPPGSNSGAAVQAYQAATDLGGTGWPWCAAFVCWVAAMAAAQNSGVFPATMKLPKTAAAFGFLEWAKANGCKILSPGTPGIRRGDIVVYRFSHIGIVSRPPMDVGQAFEAIEGNTDAAGSREGGMVAIKRRTRSSVRKFIQLPIA